MPTSANYELDIERVQVCTH